jgi:hypothetical protein
MNSRTGFCMAIGLENPADECGPDDDSIGVTRHAPRLLSGGYTKAYGNG